MKNNKTNSTKVLKNLTKTQAKKEHLKKVKEMMREDKKFLLKRVNEFLNSKELTLDKYDPNNYYLSKIILFAAISDLSDQRIPLDPDARKTSKNLSICVCSKG